MEWDKRLSKKDNCTQDYNTLGEKIDSIILKWDEKKNLVKSENNENYSPINTGVSAIQLDKVSIYSVSSDSSKLVDEKSGFGWKGLGSRRIFYDKELDEYVYEIREPKLSNEEKELMNKLVYLFGVSADFDVFDKNIVEKSDYLESTIQSIIENNHIDLKNDSKDRIFYYIFQDFIGFGKIDILMHDRGIEDISCDGTGVPVFIFHKDLESIRTNIVFGDADNLDNFVVKLSQICGKQISVYNPIVDGKLDDGSRLSATLAKTVTLDSNFTIRRFREEPFTPIDLISSNTLSIDMAVYFWLVIENGSNILFCGGTASGKTTALNALALFIPFSHKIVSIEDTREVNLPHENWIAGTTRTGFSQSEESRTGKDIDMFDLTRTALRQRPKVIIVGEVRGREAYTLFQAMTTGHLSYSTVHAGDIRTLIQRLESPPINLPRSLLTALDVVVFLNSVTVEKKPVRRFTSVMEIIKLESESNRLITFTPFSWISEVDDRFEAEEGSRIFKRIKFECGLSDEDFQKEFENRKRVLSWMVKRNIRSYREVSKIISKYCKNPTSVLKQIEEDGI